MNEPLPTAPESGTTSTYRTALFGGLSGRYCSATTPICGDYPLLLALHGGTFDSRYFDIAGFSLIERARLLGLPVLAPDRPGYGESLELQPGQQALDGNAAFLRDAIGEAWRNYRGSARGIVIIGHSIGAAIALLIAAETCAWPLLGLCVSGLALRTPPQSREAISALPGIPKILQPNEAKDSLMFGPAGSFDAPMPEAIHVANTPVPTAELVEIVTQWHDKLQDVAGKIEVPIHYRQAEFDRLWMVDEEEVGRFAAMFPHASRVDAAMVPAVGHCIDFHRSGAALHVQQLGFALQCAAASGIGLSRARTSS